MADEDAELIGGISVSVGASHSRLATDLAEANRILDAWAKQAFTVQIRAQVQVPTGQAAAAARQATPAAPFVGSSAGSAVRAAREQGINPGYQKAINDALAKEGKSYNAMTGDIEEATTALGRQRTVVAQVQQQAAEPTKLNVDTEALKADLAGILALMKEVVAEAATLGKTNIAAGATAAAAGEEGAAAAPGRRLRRKPLQARDIGQQADRNRVYSFDPGVYDEQDRLTEARSARAREQALADAGKRSQARDQAAESSALRADARARSGQARQAAQPAVFPPMVAGSELDESREVAPQHTQASRAAAQREQERRTAANAARSPLSQAELDARAARAQAQAERANAPRAGDDFEGRRGVRGTATQRTEEDVERRRQERIAQTEAQAVSAGRTQRTQESSLGGFVAGRRDLGRAQADLAAANEKVRISQRNLTEAEVKGDPIARKHAIQELTVAENERGDALKRIQSFSGPVAAIRNLAGIATAGFAFGAAFQAVSVAMQAAEKVAAPYFDAFTGYAQKTSDLTNALSDQARQQQGNVQGVVSLKLAQAGFSQSSASAIQPIIAERTQIEAGNKALQEQIDTFRVAENIRKQSPTAGLGGGGTGGVLGSSLFGIPSTGEQTGNFLQGLQNKVVSQQNLLAKPPSTDDITSFFPGLFGPRTLDNVGKPQNQSEFQAAQQAFNRGLAFVNSQLDKGGDSAGKLVHALTPLDARIGQTAQAFGAISPEMGNAIRAARLFSSEVANSDDPISAAAASLRALNRAGTLTGPDEALAGERLRQQQSQNNLPAIRAQQEFERPAILGAIERQFQFSKNVQIPAQAALQNLAAPPTPVGTGILGRNAQEQKAIETSTRKTQDYQDALNTYYDQGFNILRDTYQIPLPLLNNIQRVGQAIADTQAGIANEQAQYQVAQINYQLRIAKRTLSDIGGLTGQNFGAGQSYLGVLERQNLALSRQAQMLQFSLSQRQINFQQAVAGFTVPGLTPAEQNARVSEAKTEADFAQKQLNIQREMFRNQVKIVDIGNLRQGRDLANQIGLLLQGRKVTIDTQLAQARLQRLQATQQKLVEEAGTYITKVNAQTSAAMDEISTLERAAGHAISRTEQQGIAAAYGVGRAFFLGITGGFLGGTPGTSTQNDQGRPGRGGPGARGHASGAIMTSGTTALGPYGFAGEAGREAVVVVRNPHALGGSGGGGSPITINFNGDNVFKTEADFQRMYRMVVTALGRDASLKGLRTPF